MGQCYSVTYTYEDGDGQKEIYYATFDIYEIQNDNKKTSDNASKYENDAVQKLIEEGFKERKCRYNCNDWFKQKCGSFKRCNTGRTLHRFFSGTLWQLLFI